MRMRRKKRWISISSCVDKPNPYSGNSVDIQVDIGELDRLVRQYPEEALLRIPMCRIKKYINLLEG